MCKTRNCGCNTPGNAMICYTKEPTQPCIGVNLTVNNTTTADGSSGTNMILEETNNISAFKDHLEFVNSPEPLSGLKRNVVLRLTDKFISIISNLFRGRNVGEGFTVYKGSTTVGADTFQDFRSFKTTPSITVSQTTDEILHEVNPIWLADQIPDFPEIPVVDYPVINGESAGNGESIYKGLVGKKIQMAGLVSQSLIIGEELAPVTNLPTGNIKIELPGGGSVSSHYYLDPSYQRPSDWGTLTNPKEEILNTTIFPTSKKVPTGKLNDPFKDYTEFLLRVVGNGAGSNVYGTFTTSNPQITGGTLQVLTTSYTLHKIEVNTWEVNVNNKAMLIHTGLEEYSVDTRRLWTADNFDAVTSKIKRPIYFNIGGEGTFSRTLGLGLIYSFSDATKTTAELYYRFELKASGLGLFLIEADNPYPAGSLTPNPKVRLTRSDGITPLSNGNVPVFGRVQPATTPLIVIDGTTSGFYGFVVSGTKVFIQSNTQAHIKYINGGNLTSSANTLNYQVGNTSIGYETKMIEDAVGNTADENIFLSGKKDLINYPSEKGFFYKPFADHVVFDIGANCEHRVENLGTEANGFPYAAASNTIRIGNNAIFDNVLSWKDTNGGASKTFIKTAGTPDLIKISNLNLVSATDVFFEGDGVSPVTVSMNNSIINTIRKISQNPGVLSINTQGTLCTIQSKPMITMATQTDNAAALLAGYLPEMLYEDATTHVVTQVIP